MVVTRRIKVLASVLGAAMVVGLPSLQAAQEGEIAKADTAKRTIMDYANAHPIVLERTGGVFRDPDGPWILSLDGMQERISMRPVRGRTDIAEGTEYSGKVFLGAHGPFLALIVDVDDGESVSAVMEFDDVEQLSAIIGPNSPLRGAAPAELSATQGLALKVAAMRLKTIFYSPESNAVSFGPFALQSTAPGPGLCAGGSCSCFLGCSVTCGQGSLPVCKCRVFNDECYCQQCEEPAAR